MAHRRYLVLLWATYTFVTCPSIYNGTEKQARGTGQCLYEKNTEHGLGRKHLVSGNGQDGLWHFACDDSPFAYIMLVASSFFRFFFFSYHEAVLGCLHLQRGIDWTGHTLVWVMKHLQLGYTVHIHSGTIYHIWRCFVMGVHGAMGEANISLC